MRILAAALVLTTALATPIVAQQASQFPGTKNPAAVTGGAYTVDSSHSYAQWTVDHLGYTPLSGLFGEVTGTLNFDPKNVAATKVDITIPVSKLAVASEAFKGHLLRPGKDGGKPDFFGATPADAKFVSTSVAAVGADKATLTGNLTLNGVTKPVTLNVSFYGAGKSPAQMGGKENVGFTATGTLKRSEFGLGLAVPVVSDDVKLDVVVAFQK